MKTKDITLGKGAGGGGTGAEHLPSSHEALGLIPRLTKRKIKDGEIKTEGT